MSMDTKHLSEVTLANITDYINSDVYKPYLRDLEAIKNTLNSTKPTVDIGALKLMRITPECTGRDTLLLLVKIPEYSVEAVKFMEGIFEAYHDCYLEATHNAFKKSFNEEWKDPLSREVEVDAYDTAFVNGELIGYSINYSLTDVQLKEFIRRSWCVTTAAYTALSDLGASLPDSEENK